MRGGLRSALAVAVVLALAAPPALAQPQELWRRDTSNLAVDASAVRACLGGDEAGLDGCLHIVQARCVRDPETWSNAAERMCQWRAIAAWEDVMAELAPRIRTVGGAVAEQFEASQTAWRQAMLANVGLVAAPYEGGSMQGPVMAAERARATADRTIWLERFARSLEFE